MASGSVYNAYQELYIEKTLNDFHHRLIIIFWTCFYQLITIILLFEIDFIPYFGYSSPSTFLTQSKNFVLCYFNVSCNYTLFLGLGFVVTFTGSYFSGIYLNAKSSNYTMIANSMVPSIVIIFFTIFSSLNNGLQYPLYVSLPCIFLNTCSLIIWWYWENKVINQYEILPLVIPDDETIQ